MKKGMSMLYRSMSIKEKRSEKKIRHLKRNTAGFLKSRTILSLFPPREGSVLDINQAGLNTLGYTFEEVQKLDIGTDIYNEPKQREILKANLIENGSIKNFEIDLS